jgi:cytosine deaminase
LLDLIVENARLLGTDGLYQITVRGSRISEIGRSISNVSAGVGRKIDAKGGLVLPTFIEPHIHLDKVLLAEKVKEASSISEARATVKNAKKHFTAAEVAKRVERVLPWAITNGVTKMRTHLDVDTYARTVSVEAVLSLRKKYHGLIDIQIVAFPQEGIIKNREVLAYLRKALDMGASVVGGLPEAENSEEDSKKHMDALFSIASEKDLDIDIHCDVLPNFRNIEYYASQILRHEYGSRATASHLIALSSYDNNYAQKIIRMIKAASLSVVCNPCTMISSGATERPPLARGITRVKELVSAGVNVSFGSDNIVDPYNPLGDLNPLSNAFLLTYAAQMSSSSEIVTVLQMPTTGAAKVLRVNNYGLRSGSDADFNVFRESTPRELLRVHGRPTHVVKGGRVLVENHEETVRNF